MEEESYSFSEEPVHVDYQNGANFRNSEWYRQETKRRTKLFRKARKGDAMSMLILRRMGVVGLWDGISVKPI